METATAAAGCCRYYFYYLLYNLPVPGRDGRPKYCVGNKLINILVY